MTKSKETKKYGRLAFIFTILSALCLFGPMIGYAVAAFIGGAAVIQKFALASSLLVCVILTLISVVGKWACRSRAFILLVGLSVCLNQFLPIFYVFAGCQIADELFISPLAAHFRSKASINKELDKRVM
jgi:hypothetical protein